MAILRRFLAFKLVILCILMVFAAQANALTITPTSTPQWIGNDTSQDDIDEILNGIIGNATELYKADQEDDSAPVESGDLASSYSTSFLNTPNDPQDAIIQYDGGNFVGAPAFLLVKDGNHVPAWYLFDLTNLYPIGWNGMETLYLNGFWPNQGAISHVTLYGTSTTPIPEPGTVLLLGVGLIGLAGMRKKLLKKK